MIKNILTTMLIYFSGLVLFAQDTVVVQTFTYDMITQRRGVFQFPEDTKQFRKILMSYSLKCDPRTPHDRFACGEWDYLTYTKVYKPTGRYDSTEKEHPFFKLGWDAPDSVEYTTKTTQTTYQNEYVKTVVDEVSNEETFDIGTESGAITFDGDVRRMQFVISSKELKEMGFTKGSINKIALKVNQPGDAVLRLAIRVRNAPGGALTNFVNYGFDTVFYSDITFDRAGWVDIMFNKPYNWTGFSSIMFEISYETLSGTAPVLAGWSVAKAIESSTADRYLYFDGRNDAVEITKKIPEYYNAEKLTIEGWVRVNSWQAWNRLFGAANTAVTIGKNTGQVFCILRKGGVNTYGNVLSVLPLNQWHHIAMVYDGSGETNKDKLKLYVDGKQKVLTFNGTIPETSDSVYTTLSFSGVQNVNHSLNGSLDEIRIWKEALDGDVISQWYNKKLSKTHPEYSNILAYYSFDNNDGTTADDEASGEYPGRLIGCPSWVNQSPMTLKCNIEQMKFVPIMKFYRGDYKTHTEAEIVEKTVDNPPISIVKYRVAGHGVEPYEYIYAWKAGYTYKYDKDRNKIDSTYNQREEVLYNHTLKYYDEPFEVVDQYEIGRFITPYGIGLDLGPDGFTWTYDVTDYAPLLQGKVDISSGNLQELHDLKFLFIKGTAPRDVIDIKRVWGPVRSYRYDALDNDTKLSEKEVQLNPDAKQFKLVTRLTGHGHYSNTGASPHCCEWKDNTHYLMVNGKQVASWHIWQTHDCALNPVYPQGGTWPGAREGWCPGDKVKDNNFELTKYIEGNSVKLDYAITPVPEDNQGMGKGNYYIAMQLIEYGDFKFDNDAEVYNVIMPSNDPYYSRKNPICANPMVVIRNNGRNPITALTIKYKVSGGVEETYNWVGNIPSNEMVTISLPISGSEFWIGDKEHAFIVTVYNEDGSEDDYHENSTFLSHFDMPDLLPEKVIIEYKTNKRPQHFTYEVKDLEGNVVLRKFGLSPETVYRDTLNFPPGCYTFEFTDMYDLGLSYWAYPAQGNGYVRFLDLNGKPVKTFNPDCGHGYNYSFNLGSVTLVQDFNENYYVQPFPNPSQDNVNLEITYPLGDVTISVYNVNGQKLREQRAYVGENFSTILPTADLPAGTYFIRVQNERYNLTAKFIKQ